jgi:hypothetical protein
LLQRLVGEGVFDWEVALPAVRPLGAHEELAATLEERRQDAVMLEAGAVESRAHGAVIRDSHRLGVVRFGEGGRLVRVTGGAFLLPDEPIVN